MGAKNAGGGSPISSILGVATGGDKLGCWFLNQIEEKIREEHFFGGGTDFLKHFNFYKLEYTVLRKIILIHYSRALQGRIQGGGCPTPPFFEKNKQRLCTNFYTSLPGWKFYTAFRNFTRTWFASFPGLLMEPGVNI